MIIYLRITFRTIFYDARKAFYYQYYLNFAIDLVGGNRNRKINNNAQLINRSYLTVNVLYIGHHEQKNIHQNNTSTIERQRKKEK